jgi:alanine racemase
LKNILNNGVEEQKITVPFPSPFTANSWVEISKSALEHNIKQYKNVIGNNVILAPVIKANAYGHGIHQVAKILDANDSVGFACIAKLSEAITLRKQGFKKSLLVLSILDDAPEYAIQHNISVAVWDIRTAEIFNTAAQQLGKKAKLHIKVDTGLSRMGPLYNEAFNFIVKCKQLEHCTIQGLFTHFANSENKDLTFAQLQIKRFTILIEQLKKHNLNPPLIHCSSSAAQTVLPSSHFTMTRLGIGLYGLWPSPENKTATCLNFPAFSLRPIMQWKTRINMIKTVPANSFVGYDLTYKTDKPTRIATLPVGYADGYNRLLSNKGIVKINNQYAPIIGRVAMNLVMVDVTEIKNITLDAQVLLLGNDQKVNAQTIAHLCNSINYEIVTNIDSDLKNILVL